MQVAALHVSEKGIMKVRSRGCWPDHCCKGYWGQGLPQSCLAEEEASKTERELGKMRLLHLAKQVD